MATTTAVSLTGDDLTPADVWNVAVDGGPAELSDRGREQLRAARELVERAAEPGGVHTYGINTGFGRFVSKTIPPELAAELQLRLLRSHACGVGDPYPDEVVRGAMLLRANTLAKGYSGARTETVELLLSCLNAGVTPIVPSRGSVGASGDLAPLAHLALPLVGEGYAKVDGEVLGGAEALISAGLEPVELQAKEGLSLINGTQFMAAIGALTVVRPAGSRARPTSRARCRSRRCRARGAASSPRSMSYARSRASGRAPRTSSACSRARPSSRPTAGATRCRTRTPFAVPRRSTGRAATCWPTPRRRSPSS
jgi:histidine ammonia-lyase